MVYGDIKLIKKDKEKSVISVDNTRLIILKGDTIKVLSDTNANYSHGGNCELFNVTYDEFINSFDEYGMLTDDLSYVYGISIE